MTSAQILNTAADLIEKRGKPQRGLRNWFKGWSTIGDALLTAAFGQSRAVELEREARVELMMSLHTPFVGAWSESHTAAEVVAGLRAAARPKEFA